MTRLLQEFARRRHWIFDLDGTLTVAVHDFDGIRRELGLDPDHPILEQLAAMPEAEAAPLRRRLDEIEIRLAEAATMQAGADHLLEKLAVRNARMGILTRNSRENALATLEACGLGSFFAADTIIGRDCASPKPSGDGIRRLLGRWSASPDDTVMVGDYLFDIMAGHDAGTGTVYFDPAGHFEHGEHADAAVSRLAEITAALAPPGDITG